MTTSMKTPDTMQPLAPVVELDDVRATKSFERANGRKPSMDSYRDTIKIALHDTGISLNRDVKVFQAENPFKQHKLATGILVGMVAVWSTMGAWGPKVSEAVESMQSNNEPAYTQAELSAIPDEFHVQVDGGYGIGHIKVFEEAAEQGVHFGDEQVEHDVADYIDNQIQHSNPRTIDVPNVEAYEASLEENKQSNNG